METTDLVLKAEINLYYDVHIPDDARSAPLLIAVHGYGAHKRYMMREARAVAPADFVIASVQVTTPAGARLHLQDVRLVTVVERPR